MGQPRARAPRPTPQPGRATIVTRASVMITLDEDGILHYELLVQDATTRRFVPRAFCLVAVPGTGMAPLLGGLRYCADELLSDYLSSPF